MEEGWVPTSAQRSSSQQELDRSTATRTQKALGSYIRRSPSPDVPFYLLSSSAAPPSSITNQQNSSPDSGRASLFTSPLAQDLPPKIDRISSPSFHVHSQCSYGDHANSNNERVQTSNVPAGDSQDDPQSPLTIPECVLPLPRVQPSQTTRAPTWSFVTPVSQLPDQQRDRRDIPRIYPRNVDNKEPGRALGEPPSYQLSDSLQTAANNIPDELAFRSQEEILLPRPTSSSWKASQYGYSDRESEAKDDEDHEDDNIDQSEDDCGYGEDEEWNENVRPEECDWGQNGESGPADWDRINAEDQAFLNANGVHAGLREDDDLTGNHDVKPPGRHGEATINEADYSKDSEEEERAIEHQLRLSQRSSEQIDNLTQHESKADARDHTSAAKGKGRASDSQSRATYASKVPKNRRLHNAKLSNPASRRSSNSGPPHTGNRSPYFPVVHDQSNVTFPSGSPKLGNAGGPSSQARTNSPRSSQPCLPSQQREGQRRQAPSQPSTQSQQGQVQTQQRRVSSNQARPASGQPQKPHPSSNQSRHASSSQPTHHATPGPSTRPRNPTRHASQFISINKTVKQEPDATIQPQTEQGEGRRSKQKEEERKRNLELVRKSEEWEWKYGSGRLAVVQGHGQEENEDQDDSGSDSHGEREFVVEQDDESGTSKSESESSSEGDEEEDFSDDDLTGLGTRVVVSESDSTTSSSSSEDEDEGERVVETRRRRGFY